MTATNFTNHLLIAMPALADPNFSHTVTYVCQHSDDGAMGIVINRPSDLRLGELLDHLGLEPAAPGVTDQTVFVGGPVQQERGFILHQPAGEWDATLKVNDQIALTASQDILEAIAGGSGPARTLVALGYAGWGAGQLEQEMADNAWLNGPAEPGILFDTPYEHRWEAAAAMLGVDLQRLSGDPGHA